MPAKLSRALLIFALLVVAVVSWQWIDDRNVSPRTEPGSIQMADNQSDYYLEDFEITNVSNSGSTNGVGTAGRRLVIAGDTLSHHFPNGHSTLANPTVLLRNEQNEYWLASARSGRVSAEFDLLDLQGAVELTHNKQSPNSTSVSDASVKVDTESLTIDTTQRIIQTNDPVAVNGQGWNYTANSMRAEVDNGTLSFQSGVEARFANPN